MRTCAALLMLVALPVAAQQPELTGITADGMVTWTNAETNVYCSLYFTWDLNDQWFPVWLNRLATNATDSGPTHLAMHWDQEPGVTAAITAGQFDESRAFYRVVCSSSAVERLSISVTNTFAFVNVGSSVVSNVTLGICWGNVAVSNLPPTATSTNHPIIGRFPYVWDYRFQNSLIFDDDACIFLQGEYFQNGTRKDLYFPFQFFAMPGYEVTVLIDDETYSLMNEELPTTP
jgi:hypothetical protein